MSVDRGSSKCEGSVMVLSDLVAYGCFPVMRRIMQTDEHLLEKEQHEFLDKLLDVNERG